MVPKSSESREVTACVVVSMETEEEDAAAAADELPLQGEDQSPEQQPGGRGWLLPPSPPLREQPAVLRVSAETLRPGASQR